MREVAVERRSVGIGERPEAGGERGVAEIGRGLKIGVFDPVEALANFKPGAYDLIISDIKMPKMNGFEMVYELEKIDDSVRVIFLTGFVDMLKELT